MLRLPLAALALGATLVGADVRATPLGSSPVPTRSTTRPDPDGKTIYLKNCKQCHGTLGEPTKMAKAKYDKIPNFQDPEFFKRHSHEEMIEAITKGKGEMKGFADKLSKDEVQAVMLYVHTLEKKG